MFSKQKPSPPHTRAIICIRARHVSTTMTDLAPRCLWSAPDGPVNVGTGHWPIWTDTLLFPRDSSSHPTYCMLPSPSQREWGSPQSSTPWPTSSFVSRLHVLVSLIKRMVFQCLRGQFSSLSVEKRLLFLFHNLALSMDILTILNHNLRETFTLLFQRLSPQINSITSFSNSILCLPRTSLSPLRIDLSSPYGLKVLRECLTPGMVDYTAVLPSGGRQGVFLLRLKPSRECSRAFQKLGYPQTFKDHYTTSKANVLACASFHPGHRLGQWILRHKKPWRRTIRRLASNLRHHQPQPVLCIPFSLPHLR